MHYTQVLAVLATSATLSTAAPFYYTRHIEANAQFVLHWPYSSLIYDINCEIGENSPAKVYLFNYIIYDGDNLNEASKKTSGAKSQPPDFSSLFDYNYADLNEASKKTSNDQAPPPVPWFNWNNFNEASKKTSDAQTPPLPPYYDWNILKRALSHAGD